MVGFISALCLGLLLLNVSYSVFVRYFLDGYNPIVQWLFKPLGINTLGNIAFQEAQWHLFAISFLFGLSYAIKHDAHVRVDAFYSRFRASSKAKINLIFSLLFLIPFILLVFWYSLDFVQTSYLDGEISGDPGGLPYRFIIKAMIPLGLIFCLLAVFSKVLTHIKDCKC